VRINEDVAPEPLSGIGDMFVAEWVPTMVRVVITTNQASLRVPLSDVNTVVQGLVFDIAIVNNGRVVRRAKDCSYSSGGIEVRKHQIVYSNATFNGIMTE